MKNDQILSQITDFCRQSDMAETTFGRRSVNDGKLVHRLREGKRITIDTLDRIQAYIATSTGTLPPPRGLEVPPEKRDPRGNFAFSKTGRNTCCSSTPAARSGSLRNGWGWSSPACTRGRRR
jgi:hypothetical protein